MKVGFVLVAVALLLGAGCAPDGGNHRNVELSPQDWTLPGPDSSTQVFGPMPYEEVTGFVRSHEHAGWSVIGYSPAGEHLDGKYLVTMRRWK